MTTAAPQRRQPVQERSRQTVARILDAAEALIDEGGVEAVTTRAVADRAGVTYPSLYRFFADREEILDQLVDAPPGHARRPGRGRRAHVADHVGT